MNRRLLLQTIISLSGILFASAIANAADYTGKYSSDKLAVEILPDGPGYRGEIRMGGQTLSLIHI